MYQWDIYQALYVWYVFTNVIRSCADLVAAECNDYMEAKCTFCLVLNYVLKRNLHEGRILYRFYLVPWVGVRGGN